MIARIFIISLCLTTWNLTFPLDDSLFAQQNNKVFPGADNRTPSRSEYFTWINNTGEGSTENQTLINLDFFKWLRDEYGMRLDIYAFDAGNIDKDEHYGSQRTSKFEMQFPHGYGPICSKAAEIGTRLGVWDEPDRFGNTPEEIEKRIEQMVSLCRDFHFELFKFDATGGILRDARQDDFIRMMTECRKYSPDLILLNHRLNLSEKAVPYATTHLMDGEETYIDVHMANDQTAPHHRAGALSRALPADLSRLVEDHGVCFSSCPDYWEDDLILQAFNRNLILAPEIYGNPWFLRDDEYPKLARIFNLAREYKEILVNGMVLPEDKYGVNAVSRGDEKTRLLTLRNLTWDPVVRNITLGMEIGLKEGSVVEVRQLHPVERFIGRFRVGQTIPVEVLPFRACLLIASTTQQTSLTVEGCDYEIVRDIEGKPLNINLLGFPGESKKVTLHGTLSHFNHAFLDGKPVGGVLKGKALNIAFPGNPLQEKYHRKLGAMDSIAVPADAEGLYEATCFAADNNALEVRSLMRSSPTLIPQVQKARDEFFNQKTFVGRGLWDRNLFDGDTNTSFYVDRRHRNDPRINGGSLRIDLAGSSSPDSIKIIMRDDQALQPFVVWQKIRVEVSSDLITWTPVFVMAGKEMVITFAGIKPFRYLRFPGTPESISEIYGYKDGSLMDRSRWRASNLFSPYGQMRAKAAFEKSFVLNEIPKGSYLAIALNGRHGEEGAYAAIRVNGKPVGAPDRSPSYLCNAWEYPVVRTDSNYTYYVPLTEDMKGAKIDAMVLVMKNGVSEFKPEVWITAYPIPYEKVQLQIE